MDTGVCIAGPVGLLKKKKNIYAPWREISVMIKPVVENPFENIPFIF